MSVIRKYKLQNLDLYTLNNNELKDVKFLLSLTKNIKLADFLYKMFFNLEQVRFDDYVEAILFFKNKEFYMEYDLVLNKVRINNDKIYKKLYDDFYFSITEIQELTIKLFKYMYNFDIRFTTSYLNNPIDMEN